MSAHTTLLELARPLVVAPMGGGPSTPDLVIAAGEAGALGFLAGCYKTPEGLSADISAVRSRSPRAFGVNLFLPGTPGDPVAIARYIASLEAEADRQDAALGDPVWEDDRWLDKVEVLLADPVPVVSFTFGCPSREIVEALRERGTLVVVTVTQVSEALHAAEAGADLLCCQGAEAGGHRGSFFNEDPPPDVPGIVPLVQQVSGATDLPLIGAGGVGSPNDVASILGAGATAVQAGTAFLRCPESGTSAVHKAALADTRFTATALTRAFSGRPARGLVNRFMSEHSDAPPGFPEINNATRSLRARATANNDPDAVSLWAGVGFRAASEAHAGEIVEHLTSAID